MCRITDPVVACIIGDELLVSELHQDGVVGVCGLCFSDRKNISIAFQFSIALAVGLDTFLVV